MTQRPATHTISNDSGLLRHWTGALGECTPHTTWAAFATQPVPAQGHVWLDLNTPNLPAVDSPVWPTLKQQHPGLRWVATDSHPQDSQALQWLDIGFAGYCHAFADADTLRQVAQVVAAGHVWVGPTLMRHLIHSAGRASAQASGTPSDWATQLTLRERQVARLAAQGASNLSIAQQCNISERTVKAHMAAIFEKLAITDRLQLALRVHGIQT